MDISDRIPGEYITVAEFADLAGVSQQAVYKRLKTSLKPFAMEIDGKRMVSISGLDLFKADDTQPVQSEVAKQIIDLKNRLKCSETESTLYKQDNKRLTEQVEMLCRQNEELNERLKEASILHLNDQSIIKTLTAQPKRLTFWAWLKSISSKGDE